jgi:hypothetical protein
MLLFGGMMVNRVDIQHFLEMRRSLRSLSHCAKLLLRYARDRISHPRGTRLAMGNALIARMATVALRKGMTLRLNVNVLSLVEHQGAVTGVNIECDGQQETLQARCGVVLAAGGFAAGELAARYRPHTREHYSMSPAANDGAAFRLASALNACEGADLPSNFSGRRSRYCATPTGAKNASRTWSPTGPSRGLSPSTKRRNVSSTNQTPTTTSPAPCKANPKTPLFSDLRCPGDETLRPRSCAARAGEQRCADRGRLPAQSGLPRPACSTAGA